MIIPKRDAKEYGAIHIDNYLSFIGFCKKVSSDEICDVDVYLDGKIIDTLKANQNIQKVENIYDIQGHGFEFELEEKYYDKSHLLEFKSNKENEVLVNSGIQTIDKNHDKFNEYKFLNSLSKPLDEEKIKDMYCKDAIGFLAVEENLNDKDFIEYIKELYIRFPQVTFKAFYFNDHCKSKIENIFKDELDRVRMIIPLDMSDISKYINIYILNDICKYERIIFNLIREYFYISAFYYTVLFKDISIQESIEIDKNSNHPLLESPEKFNFKRIDLENNNFSIYKILFMPFTGEVNLNKDVYEYVYFDTLGELLKNKTFQEFYISYQHNECKYLNER